jgi:hypothetical protein
MSAAAESKQVAKALVPIPFFNGDWVWIAFLIFQLLFWSIELIFAFTGQRLEEQPSASRDLLGNIAFFALMWRRLKRRWWVGALMGFASTSVLFFLAGFIAAFNQPR